MSSAAEERWHSCHLPDKIHKKSGECQNQANLRDVPKCGTAATSPGTDSRIYALAPWDSLLPTTINRQRQRALHSKNSLAQLRNPRMNSLQSEMDVTIPRDSEVASLTLAPLFALELRDGRCYFRPS